MITARETTYAGHRFRSRIEARHAVVMSELGVRWEYEQQGYVLDGQAYLPDFWLPDLRTFLEVKGQVATEEEAGKAEKLAAESGFRVLIAWGDIPDWRDVDERGVPNGRGSWMERYEPDGDGGAGWDDRYVWCWCPRCGCVGVEYEGRSERIDCGHHDWADGEYSCGDLPNGSKVYTGLDDRILAAYEAGRGARFEHGESGYTKLPRQRSTRAQDPPYIAVRRPRRLGELLPRYGGRR